ncbi:hypothetical protein CDS [Salmonella enterica subsp. enterica serovar Derby]|uniref:Uncharacterized protein n=1 Tax=Salmonella enterica subsp. enterica serovar Cubana str. 76814 TaxID=1192560 RepID=V7INJ5_SALET|nr:hypothetical protein A628_02199 [Salmonella enterica subsp. enterica serovar Cubana str. 76814]VXG72895.1 hypothetical protein CDS [Salmonella enterica subsp. enterica serovar Derby]
MSDLINSASFSSFPFFLFSALSFSGSGYLAILIIKRFSV